MTDIQVGSELSEFLDRLTGLVASDSRALDPSTGAAMSQEDCIIVSGIKYCKEDGRWVRKQHPA